MQRLWWSTPEGVSPIFYQLPAGLKLGSRKALARMRKDDRKMKKRTAMLIRKGPAELLTSTKKGVVAHFEDGSTFLFRPVKG